MGNPYSQLGPDDFQEQALNLLPTGPAWPRDLGTILAKFWGAVADLLAHNNFDIATVIDQELNPATTTALLPDWEAEFGLPDPCNPDIGTVEERRAALLARITDEGNLSRQKYIDLAAALGFEVTITEFTRSSGIGTCIGPCTEPVLGTSWRFAWQVNAPAETVTDLTCIGDCRSPLRSWGNAPLECLIRRHNRPSRFVLFSYG